MSKSKIVIVLAIVFCMSLLCSCEKEEIGNKLLGSWIEEAWDNDGIITQRTIIFISDYSGGVDTNYTYPDERVLQTIRPFTYSIKADQLTFQFEDNLLTETVSFSASGDKLTLTVESNIIVFTKL